MPNPATYPQAATNLPTPQNPQPYIGRFAPSPTGPLHFGSLIAAVASYLDAKAHRGLWLLRIEDLDPPREVEGAATAIQNQLAKLGLEWDGDVLFQSARLNAYEHFLNKLMAAKHCFYCNCTRARMQSLGAVYDGHCRSHQKLPKDSSPAAIRVAVSDQTIHFNDRIQGGYQQNLLAEVGDFVVRRKDKLFAYQLAVVADDHFQGITDIVRGHDLIDSTPRQIYLQQLLGFRSPSYAHFPVAANKDGDKLSKQHHAQAIELKNPAAALTSAMEFLGLKPPAELAGESAPTVLKWGIANWDVHSIPKLATINGLWN